MGCKWIVSEIWRNTHASTHTLRNFTYDLKITPFKKHDCVYMVKMSYDDLFVLGKDCYAVSVADPKSTRGPDHMILDGAMDFIGHFQHHLG